MKMKEEEVDIGARGEEGPWTEKEERGGRIYRRGEGGTNGGDFGEDPHGKILSNAV